MPPEYRQPRGGSHANEAVVRYWPPVHGRVCVKGNQHDPNLLVQTGFPPSCLWDEAGKRRSLRRRLIPHHKGVRHNVVKRLFALR